MGCRKCGGRLLAVHSDNPEILMTATREALLENKQGISLARATGETKLPDASPSAQTLIVETLVNMDQQRFYAREDRQPYSVTAYHLTNSGQSSPLDEKSPPLKIYHLPMEIVRFLGKMYQPDYKSTWNALVLRGKERPKIAKGKQTATKSGTKEVMNDRSSTYHARNYFYEDILRLPDEARRFVRKYFLRVPELHAPQTSASTFDSSENLQKERNLVPWSFIVLFLKEVLYVDKKRIEEIGKLGERLAAYVKEFDDKRFFSKFYELQRPDYFRSELLRATKNAASHGRPPLFRFEEFCMVFFESDAEDLRLDWRLARDLVFIRMLEWLYDHDDKLQEHVNALAQERDTETPTLNDEQQ